jgi:hypothetical protein
MADRGNEFEKIRRQLSDLLYDLHARKLTIPAGLLVVLIVGSMLVLPKSPSPPPAQTSPTASAAPKTVEVAQVADLKLVSATPLTADPLTFGSENPFAVSAHVKCRFTKTSKPREIQCLIGSTLVTYKCMASDQGVLCAADGSSGATGASGGGGTGSTDSTGGRSPKIKSPPKPKSTYYVVDVTFDGKKLNDLVAGDALPRAGSPAVFYAGPNSSAIFVLADGASVQGADANPDLGNFTISAGDAVVLTTAAGDVHHLKLRKLRKVTK